MPIQKFNNQNSNPGEQRQYNDLEASPFYLVDDSEQPPLDS